MGSNTLADIPRILRERTSPAGDCLLWRGARDRDGYGQIKIQGRQMKAHRVVFALVHGDPGTLLVCHTCDVPSCVNPAHLFAGTNRENMHDCKRKGRLASRRGVRNTHAVLTDRLVRAIIVRRRSGESLRSLAAAFDIGESTVSMVARGLSWPHVFAAVAREGVP